jgi:WD40 repeat protein
LYNQERICLSIDFHTHNTDLLLTGNNNGHAHVWSMRQGKPKFAFTTHKDAIHTAKFFNDKKCYTGSADRSIRLWDLNKGNIDQTFMCISPCTASATDGYHIYSGHSNGSLKLWNEKSKGPVIDTKIHSSKISCLMLTKNDNYLVRKSPIYNILIEYRCP